MGLVVLKLATELLSINKIEMRLKDGVFLSGMDFNYFLCHQRQFRFDCGCEGI